MNESVGIPRLLQNARIERGIDLESLSKKTGVAMNHLLDIEAGRSSGFHSPAYCRKAVMMIARELDLESRVAELWSDSDWGGPPDPLRRLSGMEVSSPTLLPAATSEQSLLTGWRLPAAGLVVLGLVAWMAMGRIDDAPPQTTKPIAAVVSTQPLSQPSPQPPPAVSEVVQTPTATPAPKVAAADVFRLDVERAMQEWAKQWRARNADAYSAFYAQEFPARAQHLNIRRSRMSQAASIQLEISELTLRETGPSEITARFRQVYRSDSYESKDLKEIVWRQTAQGPKIMAERLVN